MTIRVQPSEGVFLCINTFVPTLSAQQTQALDLDLTYRGREIPDAYEVLFLDALKGDTARSVRGDELDASWKIWTPLLHYLDDENEEVKPREYAYGMSNPTNSANEMKATKLVFRSVYAFNYIDV